MQKDVSNSLSELQPAISLRLILCSPSSAQLGVGFHDGTPRGISASANLGFVLSLCFPGHLCFFLIRQEGQDSSEWLGR